MADLIEDVKEEDSEIETDSVSLEQQASIAYRRKRKMSDQSKGLDNEQIQKLMKKVKSTLQQNAGTSKKGKKSTILVFYHHPQNVKKNENQPMADEEIPEDSSTSSSDDSPSTPQCPPGARDLEVICCHYRKSPERIVICLGIKQQRWSPL